MDLEDLLDKIVDQAEKLTDIEIPDEDRDIAELLKDVEEIKHEKGQEEVRTEEEERPVTTEEMNRDGSIELEVSEDKMVVYATFYPSLGTGQPLTLEQVKKEIKDNGFVLEPDEKQIQEAIEKSEREKKAIYGVPVVHGRDPQNGKDAYIEFLYERGDEANIYDFNVLDRIDYREIQNFHIVNEGDLIAEKHPATEGKPGMNVYGEEIPAEDGKDIELQVGEGVRVSPDGLKYYATKSGRVAVINNVISVTDTYFVEGNVDMSVGNIKFPGDVIITGSVNEGFVIKASRNILIMGNVEGAEIIAGGNVIIRNGFRGKGKGRIVAKGKVFVRFVENARIEARDNIIVSKAVINSRLKTPKYFVALGEQGLVVGSTVYATLGIYATVVGSELNVPTYLNVGVDLQAQKMVNEIDLSISKLSEPLKKINMVVSSFQKMNLASLPPQLQQKLAVVFKKKVELATKLKILEQKRQVLLERLNIDTNANITIKERVYPGVVVRIGSATMNIKNEMGHVTFTKSKVKNKISIGLFKEWENLKELMKSD